MEVEGPKGEDESHWFVASPQPLSHLSHLSLVPHAILECYVINNAHNTIWSYEIINKDS